VTLVSIEKPSVWERLMTIGWITAIGAPLLYIAVVNDTTESLALGALVVFVLGSGLFMISAYSAIVSAIRGLIKLNEDMIALVSELRSKQK